MQVIKEYFRLTDITPTWSKITYLTTSYYILCQTLFPFLYMKLNQWSQYVGICISQIILIQRHAHVRLSSETYCTVKVHLRNIWYYAYMAIGSETDFTTLKYLSLCDLFFDQSIRQFTFFKLPLIGCFFLRFRTPGTFFKTIIRLPPIFLLFFRFRTPGTFSAKQMFSE